MARAEGKHTATDEFFINAADNPDLDHRDESDEGFGYCVFGRVVEGMDTVKKINWKVTKPRGGFAELPVEPVVIVSVQRFD
jgi:peptidyl-prolyl cis-trans isomerase B (cyclophilin B)